MSGKLLHERLREADGTCTVTVRAAGFSCNDMENCQECYTTLRKALADEIERQYVPVPRFPDGEPVREGSETRYGTVSCIDVEVSDGGWGNWVLRFDDGECIEGTFSQRAERPVPKVLDADGVEIKVGKPIYDPKGKYKTVQGFEGDEDEWLVWCGEYESNTGIKVCYIPSECTHREPDSLEKAMERFQGILEDHDGLEPETEDELRKVHSRLTALMERGAR